MTLQIVFWLLAAILMAISAFVEPVRPSLYRLAWAFFIFGFAVNGIK